MMKQLMTLLIALAISAGAYAKEITANAHSIDLTISRFRS